ncbi:MAG: hypothetical protein PHQ35_01620 [Phycisphaerae bacterium]|nr:hypothetical protein [Phycisphaerae bacterium]MDD5380346.1 hypothetical protein [Phycisphaerae bacterium]
MLEYKAGLHKEVSAIFNGVSLPKNDGAQRPSAVPAPEPPAQKPPAPSHMTPTKPKFEQPLQPSPKAAPAEQSKANTIIKAVKKAVEKISWRRTLEQVQNKLFASKQGVITAKQKMMVILAPVLFIVLIFLFIRAFSVPSRKITGAETFEPVRVAGGSNSKVDWQIPSPYPTTLRDPMQFGSVAGQTGTGELVVKGIVYSRDNPSALIGNQIVHQGDKILDVVVTKINENSVEFEANNKKWIQNVQR